MGSLEGVVHPKNSKIMGIPTINKVTAISGIMMFRVPFVGFFMSMRNYQVTNHNCSTDNTNQK